MKKEIKWEKIKLNPKLFIPGTLYRCPKCRTEILVPYGHNIHNYNYCNNCKIKLVYSEVN